MHRLSALALLVVGLVVSGSPALATTVIVPDDFATIQAAIDSEPDTVLIREGNYFETPVVGLSVTIVGIGVGSRPRLVGLDLRSLGDHLRGRLWSVSGCDFSGRVEFRASHRWDVSFSECAMDSGLVGPWKVDHLGIRNSRIGGRCEVSANSIHMEADTLDTGVTCYAEFHVNIINCWFTGGPGHAIDILDAGPDGGRIADNRIENYDVGIYFRQEEGHVFERNTISGCSTGIYVNGYDARVLNNFITDCGVGIESRSDNPVIHDNTILRAAGAGIDLFADYDPVVLEGNIVGECGGPGILVRGDDDVTLRNNTFFNNQGSGIEYFGASGSAHNNISVGNAGWGVSVVNGGRVTLGCNDWFGNVLGGVDGTSLDPSDLSVDPLFCDVAAANVSLMSGSPLLDAAGCGPVGALGLGCGATPVLIAFLRAMPEPAAIRIEWQWGGLERPAQSWIERASDASGPWEQIATERRVESGVTVDIDREVEPSQSYYYHLAWVAEDGRRGTSESVAVTAPGAIHFALGPITPNPSHGRVEIAWSLPKAGHVDLDVFDIAGREVANVARGHFASGRHVATWHGWLDSGPAPPGLYFARLRFDGHEATKRVLVRQ